MNFEWDAATRSNFEKHRIPFHVAVRAFEDPNASEEMDRDTEEERWRLLGMVEGRVLFVVYTETARGTIRIISARRATKHEEASYFEL